jgi:hypothetical protein
MPERRETAALSVDKDKMIALGACFGAKLSFARTLITDDAADSWH